MELGYTFAIKKSFDETVAELEKRTADKGFRVLYIHDVQSTLAEKGLQRGRFKIMEICNSKFAYKALAISEDVGLFMPCKINIYEKGGQTVVSAMRPSMISEFFNNNDLKQLAYEVDAVVRSIVDEVKQE